MKKHIALLTLLAALIYGAAAYTRPNEPAGEFFHEAVIPTIKDALPERQHIPFSGMLKFDNEYSHRPTVKPLEVVPPTATPYTPHELNEIYPTN
jgi:hypothetical protein